MATAVDVVVELVGTTQSSTVPVVVINAGDEGSPWPSMLKMVVPRWLSTLSLGLGVVATVNARAGHGWTSTLAVVVL